MKLQKTENVMGEILPLNIMNRYTMFGGEGNLVSSLVFFANTPAKHDISVYNMIAFPSLAKEKIIQ